MLNEPESQRAYLITRQHDYVYSKHVIYQLLEILSKYYLMVIGKKLNSKSTRYVVPTFGKLFIKYLTPAAPYLLPPQISQSSLENGLIFSYCCSYFTVQR